MPVVCYKYTQKSSCKQAHIFEEHEHLDLK